MDDKRMGKVFHSDAGYDFTMQAVMLVVIAVVSLGVLIGCQTGPTLTVLGDPVSSGEFYDLVVHNYTVMYPRRHKEVQETRDVEKSWAILPIARARWRLKDEDGKIWDYTSRVKRSKERWAETFARGSTSKRSVTIQKVTMTDATHSAVLWTSITDWENEARTRSGRNSRRILSHWERIDGQWRVVFTELGRQY